jgi:hypothetical protein
MIAAAFCISKRMVHIVFEPEPMTLGRYIRALRVAACRREGLRIFVLAPEGG